MTKDYNYIDGSNGFDSLFLGRTKLLTAIEEINEENILKVFYEDVLPSFQRNQRDIEYLQRFRKGHQPILYREKRIRNNIVNKIVVNHAAEIVDFKVGYLLYDPMQYVIIDTDEKKMDELNRISKWLKYSKKQSQDRILVEDLYEVGVAYRFISTNNGIDEDKCPIAFERQDPKRCGVLYSNGIKVKAILGFIETYVKVDDTLKSKYTCYTSDYVYEIMDDNIISVSKNNYGFIPIVEYTLNPRRQGGFENVIGICNALNTIASNRVDGVEQVIQSILKFVNVDIDQEGIKFLEECGAIKLKSNGDGRVQDVEYLTVELNQQQTQILYDSLYQDLLVLCYMPNRNGGTSTSDTGAAVIMRDGWSAADGQAKKDEECIRDGETDFIDKLIKLSNKLNEKLTISTLDIDVKFTRKNYENIQQKSQVLTTMLNNEKIHPKLAFSYSGLFTDPESAYKISEEYYKEYMKEQERKEKETRNEHQSELEESKTRREDNQGS